MALLEINEEKKQIYKNELMDAIQRYKFMRWEHIQWDALSFSRSTAYNYGLNEMDDIKEALLENRKMAVNYLLNKWIKSENATLQIAAMRMIADDVDRQRLNQAYIDHTSGGQKIEPINIQVVSEEAKDNLKQLIAGGSHDD